MAAVYVARRAHTFTNWTVNLMHVVLQYINKNFNCEWKGPRQTRSPDWRSHSWRETCGPLFCKAEVAQVVSDTTPTCHPKSRTFFSGTTCRLPYYRLRCGSSEIVPRNFRVPATEKQTSSWLHPSKKLYCRRLSGRQDKDTVFVAEKVASLRLTNVPHKFVGAKREHLLDKVSAT